MQNRSRRTEIHFFLQLFLNDMQTDDTYVWSDSAIAEYYGI